MCIWLFVSIVKIFDPKEYFMKLLSSESMKKNKRLLAVLAGGCSALLALQTTFLPFKTANAYSNEDPNMADWISNENLIVSTDSSGNVTFNKTVLDQIAKAGGWTDSGAMIAAVQNNSGTYDAKKFMTNPDSGDAITNGIQIALGTYTDKDGNKKDLYWTPVYLTSSNSGEAVLDLWLTSIPSDTTDQDTCYYSSYYCDGAYLSKYPANMYSTSMLRSYLNGTRYADGFSQDGYNEDIQDQFGRINARDESGLYFEYYADMQRYMSDVREGRIECQDPDMTQEEFEGTVSTIINNLLIECCNNVVLCSEERGANYQSEIWSSFLEQMGYDASSKSCSTLLTSADLSYQETEKITDYTDLADRVESGGSERYLLVNDAYGTIDDGNWSKVGGTQNASGEEVPVYNNFQDREGYSDWKNDYLWVPSVTETGSVLGDYGHITDDVAPGIWNLTAAELSNVGYGSSWLRSGIWDNDASGTYGLGYYTLESLDITQDYVRPAIHLNLGTVATNAVASPTGTTTGTTHVPATTTTTDPTSSGTTSTTDPTSTGTTSSTGGTAGTSSSTGGTTNDPQNTTDVPVYEAGVDPATGTTESGEQAVPIAVIVCAVAVPASVIIMTIALVRFIHFKKMNK
jgi:hypothetical protein